MLVDLEVPIYEFADQLAPELRVEFLEVLADVAEFVDCDGELAHAEGGDGGGDKWLEHAIELSHLIVSQLWALFVFFLYKL